MYEFINQLDFVALGRMCLIMLHIMALAAAAIAIAFGDYSLFKCKGKIDYQMLHNSARAVTFTLIALWLTGLGIIWLDTHFIWESIISKPKLLSKLTIVTILTLNGMALHWLAFPRLQATHTDRLKGATLPAIFGAVSAATWTYAAFLGIGKAAAPILGYVGFIALYAFAVSVAIAVAMVMVRPRIAEQLGTDKNINDNSAA